MKSEDNETQIKIPVAILTFVSLALLTCNVSMHNELKDSKTQFAEKEQKYIAEHLKDSSTIFTQTQTFLETSDMLDTYMERMRDMENVKEKVVFKTKTITKVEIKLADPIRIKDSTETGLYLKLPQRFKRLDRWFEIDGIISETGYISIDSLTTFATLTYAVGDTLRDGVFNKFIRKKDTIVRLHVDNPSMSITGMSNLYIQKIPKWYERTGTKIGVGILLGAVATKLILK